MPVIIIPDTCIRPKFTISGQVKDTQGEPVIGANVIIKGTTNGTITDLDGMFSIPDVEQSSVLEISFIGYTPNW